MVRNDKDQNINVLKILKRHKAKIFFVKKANDKSKKKNFFLIPKYYDKRFYMKIF